MSDRAQRLKAELDQLSYAEREEILRFLMDSLDKASEAEAETAFEAALEKRMKDFESGKSRGVPLEEFLTEMEQKYP